MSIQLARYRLVFVFLRVEDLLPFHSPGEAQGCVSECVGSFSCFGTTVSRKEDNRSPLSFPSSSHVLGKGLQRALEASFPALLFFSCLGPIPSFCVFQKVFRISCAAVSVVSTRPCAFLFLIVLFSWRESSLTFLSWIALISK